MRRRSAPNLDQPRTLSGQWATLSHMSHHYRRLQNVQSRVDSGRHVPPSPRVLPQAQVSSRPRPSPRPASSSSTFPRPVSQSMSLPTGINGRLRSAGGPPSSRRSGNPTPRLPGRPLTSSIVITEHDIQMARQRLLDSSSDSDATTMEPPTPVVVKIMKARPPRSLTPSPEPPPRPPPEPEQPQPQPQEASTSSSSSMPVPQPPVPQPEGPKTPYSKPIANEKRLIEFLLGWTSDIVDERMAHKKKRALARKRKARALLRAGGGGGDGGRKMNLRPRAQSLPHSSRFTDEYIDALLNPKEEPEVKFTIETRKTPDDPEHRYNKFLADLAYLMRVRKVYTNEGLKKLFREHKKSHGELDQAKMDAMIDELRIKLEVPKDDDIDDDEFWGDGKGDSYGYGDNERLAFEPPRKHEHENLGGYGGGDTHRDLDVPTPTNDKRWSVDHLELSKLEELGACGGVDTYSERVPTLDKNWAANLRESSELEHLGACGGEDSSARGSPCTNGTIWNSNLEPLRPGEYELDFEEELNSEDLYTENDDATSTSDSFIDEENYLSNLMEVGIDEETARGIVESCKRGGKLADDDYDDEEEEDQDPVVAGVEFDQDFGSAYSPPTPSDSRGSNLSSP